jgi:hypothetical protein
LGYEAEARLTLDAADAVDTPITLGRRNVPHAALVCRPRFDATLGRTRTLTE